MNLSISHAYYRFWQKHGGGGSFKSSHMGGPVEYTGAE